MKKSEATRKKILLAARKVFARHPYNAASIRMIGKEGGFDHPIIRYHFLNKAKLFETVVQSVCEEYCEASSIWLEGLQTMGITESFSLYLDRLIEYNFKNPEPLKIMTLNIAQAESDSLESIPGYWHLPNALKKMQEILESSVAIQAPSGEVGMFFDSINSLVISYLGASSCQAQILGVEPNSAEYGAWVKKTMMYLFLPRLKKLLYPA